MISLLVYIAVAGFLVWAITTLIPMPAAFKSVIYGLACLFLLLFILDAFGLWSFRGIRMR